MGRDIHLNTGDITTMVKCTAKSDLRFTSVVLRIVMGEAEMNVRIMLGSKKIKHRVLLLKSQKMSYWEWTICKS